MHAINQQKEATMRTALRTHD